MDLIVNRYTDELKLQKMFFTLKGLKVNSPG